MVAEFAATAVDAPPWGLGPRRSTHRPARRTNRGCPWKRAPPLVADSLSRTACGIVRGALHRHRSPAPGHRARGSFVANCASNDPAGASPRWGARGGGTSCQWGTIDSVVGPTTTRMPVRKISSHSRCGHRSREHLDVVTIPPARPADADGAASCDRARRGRCLARRAYPPTAMRDAGRHVILVFTNPRPGLLSEWIDDAVGRTTKRSRWWSAPRLRLVLHGRFFSCLHDGERAPLHGRLHRFVARYRRQTKLHRHEGLHPGSALERT